MKHTNHAKKAHDHLKKAESLHIKAAHHHDKAMDAIAKAHEAAAGHKFDMSKKHREAESRGMKKAMDGKKDKYKQTALDKAHERKSMRHVKFR